MNEVAWFVVGTLVGGTMGFLVGGLMRTSKECTNDDEGGEK